MVYRPATKYERAKHHQHVKEVLEQCDGDLRKASAQLRITYTSLSALLNRAALHDWWQDFKDRRSVRRRRAAEKRRKEARMKRMYPEYTPDGD